MNPAQLGLLSGESPPADQQSFGGALAEAQAAVAPDQTPQMYHEPTGHYGLDPVQSSLRGQYEDAPFWQQMAIGTGASVMNAYYGLKDLLPGEMTAADQAAARLSGEAREQMAEVDPAGTMLLHEWWQLPVGGLRLARSAGAALKAAGLGGRAARVGGEAVSGALQGLGWGFVPYHQTGSFQERIWNSGFNAAFGALVNSGQANWANRRALDTDAVLSNKGVPSRGLVNKLQGESRTIDDLSAGEWADLELNGLNVPLTHTERLWAAGGMITSEWNNPPALVVLPTQAQAEQLLGRSFNGKGFWPKGSDQMYIVADQIKDGADLERVIMHEAIGHYGLNQVVPDIDLYGQELFNNQSHLIPQSVIDTVARRYPDTTPANLALEWTASIAESGNIEQMGAVQHFWNRTADQFSEFMGYEAKPRQVMQAIAESTRVVKGSRFNDYDPRFKDANPWQSAGQYDPVTGTPAALQGTEVLEARNRLQGEPLMSESEFAGEYLSGATISEDILRRPVTPEAHRARIEFDQLLRKPIASALDNVYQGRYARHGFAMSPRDGSVGAMEISTRQPGGTTAWEDPIQDLLIVTGDLGRIKPELAQKYADKIVQYPGFEHLAGRESSEIIDSFVTETSDNLVWLHNQIPAEIRERSRLWYDGANRIATSWEKRYPYSYNQIAAVMAALSPQKDWFKNVTQAERVIDIWTDQQNFRWSPEMEAMSQKILTDPANPRKNQVLNSVLKNNIRGKSLAEIDSGLERAAWIRIYDEAHNDPGYRVVTPEGGMGDYMTTKPDKKGRTHKQKHGWGSLAEIEKGIRFLQDGSFENISNNLGNKHKVRSFYNNIAYPDSPHMHATIDTHAVGAGMLQPVAAKDKLAGDNFGGVSNLETGLSGLYNLHAEALARAARQVGLKPRQMQSITWEGVRHLMNDDWKKGHTGIQIGVNEKGKPIYKTNRQAVAEIWQAVSRGEMSKDEARELIVEKAGRFDDPAWLGKGPGDDPGDIKSY